MRQSVVVSGGSRGIGASVAKSFLDRNFHVYGISRTQPEFAGEEVALGNFTWIQADVADADSLRVGMERLETPPPLRLLFVNAGIGEWSSALESSRASWSEMLRVNLDGAFHTVQAALRGPFQIAPHCQVIVMGSDAGSTPFANRAAYCTSKAGLSMFVSCLREEVRSTGLRVTEIRCSRVNTGFRNKPIGSRPGSLETTDVASLVHMIVDLPSSVELRAIEASAITSTYGR